jgi:hypothetical protein
MRVHASALTRRRDYSGPRDIDNQEEEKLEKEERKRRRRTRKARRRL